MRTVFCVGILSLLVIIETTIGSQEPFEVSIINDEGPISNVDGFLYDDGELQPLGNTDASGLFSLGSLDPGALALFRNKNVVAVAECPDATAVIFVAQGEEEDGCRLLHERAEDCDDECVLLAWIPGEPVSLEGSSFPWWYVAAPTAGGGLVYGVTHGDGEMETTTGQPAVGTQATPPPPAPPPAPAAIDGFGTWTIDQIEVTGGDESHDCCTDLRTLTGRTIESTEGSIRFTGPSPWVTVMGDFSSSTGTLNTSGTGMVAGFPGVGVTFEGTIDPAGTLTGRYTMGVGGELPGGRPIEYTLQATMR